MSLSIWRKRASERAEGRYSGPLAQCKLVVGRPASEEYGDKIKRSRNDSGDYEGSQIHKDLFFVFQAVATKPGMVARREKIVRGPHPAFVDANGIPIGFRVVPIRFHHSKPEDILSHRKVAYRPPQLGTPADNRPACSSTDGVMASQWDRSINDWRNVPCSDMCPIYRIGRDDEKPKECINKTVSVFTVDFTLNIDGFPAVTAYLTTGATANFDHFAQWLNEMEAQAASRGIPLDLDQMPAELSLKMNKKPGRAYPHIHIAPRGGMVQALLSAEKLKHDLRALKGAAPVAGLLADETDTAQEHELLTRGRLTREQPEVIDAEIEPEVSPDYNGPLCPKCNGEMEDKKGWALCKRGKVCGGAIDPEGNPRDANDPKSGKGES